MNDQVNKSALFWGSCFALITTAFTFAIRAGILDQLGAEFDLPATKLGFINSMWFLGFPISMIVGGLLYNKVGPKMIMNVAFVVHTVGILMTIFAGGYTTLLISTLLLGIGNGCTEAACNPMIADMYSGKRMDKMMNRFHMWFPGGIVLGSLISKFMSDANLGWQAQIWVMMVPTVIYFVLFLGKTFPKPRLEGMGNLSENIKAMASPTFLFLFFAFALTAISEFGPQQWTGLILSESGAEPMLILALVTGLMALCRFFAGPVVGTLGQVGTLLVGAVLAAIGIFLFSVVTGPMAYVAAILFALGVAYFWPVMLGAVATKAPLTGPLGMALVGGMGMFSTSIFQPVIGNWIDSSREQNVAIYQAANNTEANPFAELDAAREELAALEEAEAPQARVTAAEAELEQAQAAAGPIELAAGQDTLRKMVAFPGILIVAFALFFIWQRGRDKTIPRAAEAAPGADL